MAPQIGTFARMPLRSFDVRALAKAINRRRQEYNRLHPERPVAVTPAMSRILENDDEYVPYRERTARQRRPVTDPRISTIVEIARRLGTTVGDLLGEAPLRLSPAERHRIKECLETISRIIR